MIPLMNFVFFDGATSSGVSERLYTVKSEILALEVTGSEGACEIYVEGMTDAEDGEWTSIAGYKTSDFSVIKTGITGNGVYEFPVEAAQFIRVHIVTADGAIKVFGRLLGGGI